MVLMFEFYIGCSLLTLSDDLFKLIFLLFKEIFYYFLLTSESFELLWDSIVPFFDESFLFRLDFGDIVTCFATFDPSLGLLSIKFDCDGF